MMGEPAFILGCGPMLPANLSALDDFFTVGVNRVVERYDPTVLIWLDAEVRKEIEGLREISRAVRLANADCAEGPHNRLRPSGLLRGPDTFVDCKNGGVSAAYWAMTLGCRPIFLLGMSARYVGNRTNFFGVNRWHVSTTLTRLKRARDGILQHPDVHAVADADVLTDVIAAVGPLARGREWYLDRFRAAHARVRSGQRAVVARR